MHATRALTLITLSLILLLIAGACSSLDGTRDRVSGVAGETTSDRLAGRAEDTLNQLNGAEVPDLTVRSSETVTLQQLQEAGIPVGSHQIDCDQPLHIVVLEGMFDRENLFETGATLSGGHAEGIAMRLVGQIYDPETENPLGMVGAQDGGRLTNLSEGGSMSGDGADGTLMFESEGNEQAGGLVPEAVCQ